MPRSPACAARLGRCLVLALLSFGCDAPTAFERTNDNDPKSPIYAPDPPSGLQASQAGKTITLAWSDNSLAEDGFIVEKSLASLDDADFEEIARVEANTTTYADASARIAPTTHYRVRAYKQRGDVVTYTMPRVTTLVLGELTSFAVEPGAEIKTTWATTTTLDTRAEIAVQIGDDPYEVVTEAEARTGTATFPLPRPDFQTYTFRLRLYFDGADGPLLLGERTGLLDTVSLYAPTGAQVTVRDERHVQLTWTDHSPIESGYEILRSVDYGPIESIAHVAADQTQFVDETLLKQGSWYYYAVRARSESHHSQASEATHYYWISTYDVENTALYDASQIRLTWKATDPSRDYATEFILERREGTGSYQPIARLPSGTRSYTDTPHDQEMRYSYRVRALTSEWGSAVTYSYQQLWSQQAVLVPATQGFAAYSPAGLAAVGTSLSNRTVEIWNVMTRQLVTKIQLEPNANAVALSADGTLLAVGFGHMAAEPEVRVYDLDRQQIIHRFAGRSEAVAFSPDGSLLASVDGYGDTRLWHLPTDAQQWVHRDQTGTYYRPRTLTFSPDGTKLATQRFSSYGGVFILDVSNGQPVTSFNGHYNLFSFPVFDPSGTRLAISKGADVTEIYTTDQGIELAKLPGYAAAFLSSSRFALLQSCRPISIYEIADSAGMPSRVVGRTTVPLCRPNDYFDRPSFYDSRRNVLLTTEGGLRLWQPTTQFHWAVDEADG